MLERANKITEKYQPIINTIGIGLALVGIYLTLIQVLQTNTEQERSTYTFSGEQRPTLIFKPSEKDRNSLKVNILQSDMLFQWARVSYHDSINGSQAIIRLHDSTWYNAELISLISFNEKINRMIMQKMKDHNFSSFIVLQTPILMELNYIKYGESRTMPGLFTIEFVVYKDYKSYSKEFKAEIRAVYFNSYLNPNKKHSEILKDKDMLVLIEGK